MLRSRGSHSGTGSTPPCSVVGFKLHQQLMAGTSLQPTLVTTAFVPLAWESIPLPSRVSQQCETDKRRPGSFQSIIDGPARRRLPATLSTAFSSTAHALEPLTIGDCAGKSAGSWSFGPFKYAHSAVTSASVCSRSTEKASHATAACRRGACRGAVRRAR